MIIEIICFIVAYSIDLSTALLHRHLKPKNFNMMESNIIFKRCVEQFGIGKGVMKYTLVHFFELTLLFIALCIATFIIFDATIVQGIEFTLVFLTTFHVLGMCTNLIAILFKKETNIQKTKIQKTKKEVIKNGRS